MSARVHLAPGFQAHRKEPKRSFRQELLARRAETWRFFLGLASTLAIIAGAGTYIGFRLMPF